MVIPKVFWASALGIGIDCPKFWVANGRFSVRKCHIFWAHFVAIKTCQPLWIHDDALPSPAWNSAITHVQEFCVAAWNFLSGYTIAFVATNIASIVKPKTSLTIASSVNTAWILRNRRGIFTPIWIIERNWVSRHSSVPWCNRVINGLSGLRVRHSSVALRPLYQRKQHRN